VVKKAMELINARMSLFCLVRAFSQEPMIGDMCSLFYIDPDRCNAKSAAKNSRFHRLTCT
jgi:hypothetical protein